ncbi:MAG: 50S ribosomal protein L9 [Clostridiales bacterium]|nr:50S ribosomal protein L9 [Clostridiales bacterium]
MKVILLKDIKGTGKKDQIIEASDGFARNYLIPKKLAVEATGANMTILRQQQDSAQHKQELARQEAEALSKRIASLSVSVEMKIGKDGRPFGSVNAKELADALQAQHGISVDKKKISIDGQVKALGNYAAEVKLYPGISAKLAFAVKEMQ